MDPALAREIFGSLGGLVEIGAASEAGSQALSDVSVADFMPRHRRELDQILDAVKEIGNFTTAVMEITEALGWFNEHEVTSASLLMWSGGIEEYSTSLDQSTIPRHVLRMGLDLQLAQLLHALVRIGTRNGAPIEATSRRITTAVTLAANLGGNHDTDTPRTVVRMWRVKFLPDLLMPSSATPADEKAKLREYSRTLEAMTNGTRTWKTADKVPHHSATGRQLSLMGDLSRGAVSPPAFAKAWLDCRRRALNEGDQVAEALSRRLDQVFYALDDYPIDPAFRETGDVTDAELLSVVVNALDQIRHDEEPRTGST
ncbi:hypothetical protein ACFXPI_25800 [Streptomyces sp. NPDC059104]|uniref:hypothetical protein n=1 Tax=Streptomyces sp. NPDC059104 TaxID=3346729 RepID=UPI0036A58DFB